MKSDRGMADFYALVWHFDGSPRHGAPKLPRAKCLFCPAGGDMGGRGTFAGGKNVGDTYESVWMIEGVKVLQGVNGKHNLPEETHRSKAYILADSNGNFVRYRKFNSDHTSKIDIDYHPEKKRSGNYSPIFHAHEYENGVRAPFGRGLTDSECAKYKKFLEGDQNNRTVF